MLGGLAYSSEEIRALKTGRSQAVPGNEFQTSNFTTQTFNLLIESCVKRAIAGAEVHVLGESTCFGRAEFAIHSAIFPLDA